MNYSTNIIMEWIVKEIYCSGLPIDFLNPLSIIMQRVKNRMGRNRKGALKLLQFCSERCN